jgi:putative ABC transport system permease protein
MLVSDFVKVSFRLILRNRSRYQGVILFIAFGIAGLIVLATLGKSVELTVGRNLEILGRAGLIKAGWSSGGSLEKRNYTYHARDLSALRRLSSALYVTPFVRKAPQLFRSGRKKISGRLIGVEAGFFKALDLRLARGRPISEADLKKRRPVCVIGSTIQNELFGGDENVLNRTVWAEGLAMKVIGVIGGVEDRGVARTVVLPISVARTHLIEITGFNGFYIRAPHWDDVEELKRNVADILHRHQSGYAEYIKVEHFPEKIKTIKNSVFLVKSLLVTAFATTLLLGGLGIANTMNAAVQERTRDIGLSKAVGGTGEGILIQFLVEAGAISVIGAVSGAILGVAVVEAAKHTLHTAPDYGILVLSIVGGLIFGVVLGVVAGLAPARKAGKLDCAEAMRFE